MRGVASQGEHVRTVASEGEHVRTVASEVEHVRAVASETRVSACARPSALSLSALSLPKATTSTFLSQARRSVGFSVGETGGGCV